MGSVSRYIPGHEQSTAKAAPVGTPGAGIQRRAHPAWIMY